jgi:hypothetical protein
LPLFCSKPLGTQNPHFFKTGRPQQIAWRDKVGKNFKLIKKVNEIPLFPGEYHFLRTQNRFQAGSETKILSFSLTNGVEVPIALNNCPLRGICSNHADRPVMCRFYPYFPELDSTGRVAAFERSIPYDWFWEDLGETMPCRISSLSIKSINSVLRISKLLVADPNNLFYMRLAHMYKRHIYEHLHAMDLVTSCPSADAFFAQWEKLLISYKLFHRERLLSLVTDLWEECERQYGKLFTVGKI